MLSTPVASSLNIEEAAAFLGLHPDTVRERAAAGIIPGVKLGKEWRFLDVDLADFMRANYGGKSCRSSCETKYGGSISGTAGDALDDLLASRIGKQPAESTMSLRLASGSKRRPASSSPTPSSSGSRKGLAVVRDSEN